MKRIKWYNIFKTILFLAATYMVLYDLYYIIIYPILTTRITTFTWVGLIVCILCSTYIVEFIKDVNKQLKKGNK